MEQPHCRILFVVIFCLLSFSKCKSRSVEKSVSIGKLEASKPKEKSEYSVITYRFLKNNRISGNVYDSYCLGDIINTNDPPFFKSFKYDDLSIDIVAPTFHKNYKGPDSNDTYRSLIRIMESSKVMNIILFDSFIGNHHIYIDSLTFMQGDFYIDLENKTLPIISLKDKLRKLEKWKSSEGLLTDECISKIPLYQIIDSISDKNLIQDMLSLDFIKISQDDLVTYDILYKRWEKERIEKARLKNKG